MWCSFAARFAETFATTVEGASVRASLPTLRRSVGLCPTVCSAVYRYCGGLPQVPEGRHAARLCTFVDQLGDRPNRNNRTLHPSNLVSQRAVWMRWIEITWNILPLRSLTRAKTSARDEWWSFCRERSIWLFGMRKDEPMFRRLVPVWVIVSTIMAGGSATAQMPFPVDLVPTQDGARAAGARTPVVRGHSAGGDRAADADQHWRRTCCSRRPTTRWSTRSTPSRAGCSGRPSSGSERALPAGSRPTRSRSS